MISTSSKIMQMAATDGLITNIMAPVPIIPRTDVHQEKYRNVGLKFGALAHSSARHARLVPRYDRRKKMEVNSAIWFNPPISKTHSTSMADTITAPMGLLPIEIFPIKWVSFPYILSFTNASRTREDPIILLKLALSVAVIIPMVMKGLHKLIPIMNM